MSKERSRFPVLNDLRELAKESDRLIELIPKTSDLDAYFSSWKEAVSKIKIGGLLKDIKLPDIKSELYGEQQVIKNKNVEIPEIQREHVHGEKNITTGNVATEIKNDKRDRKTEVIQNQDKGSILGESISTSKTIPTPVVSSKINQKPSFSENSVPERVMENHPIKTILQIIGNVSQKLVITPIMNRTYDKLKDNTIILDSVSSNSSNEGSNRGSHFRITRSASKEKLQNDKTKSLQKQTQSGSKTKLQNEETKSLQMQTRSGSKRKLSPSKKESTKKQKSGMNGNAVSISTSKAAKSKQPTKKILMKPLLANENKKAAAVIIPTMKQNMPVVSKEKQIMEEIQRKEEKANENRKKVLAERQLKVEENKKKRNEKMEKTLQKRLQIEKEKEERLDKKENDSRMAQDNAVKESVMKPILKVKTRELADQHLKEKCGVNIQTSSTPKQKETNGGTVFKTPLRLSSRDSETYDLTPAPDSSTYDFSDDDDEERKRHGKPIPSWAQGVRLKIALTQQHYNPPDLDEVFGTYVESPNLAELFGVHKKQYTKRTSSAVWHTSPGHSFCQ